MIRVSSLTNNLEQLQRRLAVGLFAIVTVLFVVYIYLVCSSVMHVVVRMELEQNIQALQTEVNALESTYITAQHNVSEHLATFAGYAEVDEKYFINRSTPSLVLSD